LTFSTDGARSPHPREPHRALHLCRIIAGEAPANFVFRDHAVVAIVDLRQVLAGHVLVMPTAHFETIDDLDEPIASKLAWATVRVSRAVRRAYAPDGINVWQSNGEAAGRRCRTCTSTSSRVWPAMA
jgi:diadenosine tetraphosphate (Ap4A) HIT family hydrolase